MKGNIFWISMEKTCIIYHSFSGITRGVAEKVRTACGGDLIEVNPRDKYSKLTAYTAGCYRARREEKDPVIPGTIDVTSYDLVVVGTPVWAWKATPVINGAIAALKGGEGKKAVIFATCGGQAGETLAIMKKALVAKGVLVSGEAVFTKKEIEEGTKINDLVSLINAAKTV
jgi:flavodoxin